MASPHRTRRYMRHHVRVPVSVIAGDREILVGLSKNFSEAGMAVYLAERLEIGQIIRLEFPVPTLRHTISVHALIRHCNGFKYGVEFQELDVADATLISTSCNRLSALLLPAESPQRRIGGTSVPALLSRSWPVSLP